MNERIDTNRFTLDCRGRTLDARPFLRDGARVMGVLNVTPDSFSDGGRYLQVEDALARTGTMLEEGAAIIDVGGESTRPAGSVYGEGAPRVEAGEELERILPVLDRITEVHPEAIVSVDTYKADVAREALRAGAHVINDVTGLRHAPELAEAVARHDAALVVMHSVGAPGELTHRSEFDDVVAEVKQSLRESVRRAEAAGVEDVVVDPGFGFGKSTRDNLRLLAASDELLELGRPLLVGISRKSSIGAVVGEIRGTPDPAPVEERLFGTLGATAVAVMRGASLVRAHDVRATVEMVGSLGATLDSGEQVGDRT